ncbi:MAG TPA: PEP-CTERM sorting domain-containing protein [Isosphaeraceae bacterium]
MRRSCGLLCLCTAAALSLSSARADVTLFDTGTPDGKIATASRPDAGGKAEIESADDFIATGGFKVNGATFTGLIVPNSNGPLPTVGEVVVEIYRVFPKDSDTVRTPNVPTRANSPSDVAFATRDSAASTLSFTTMTLSATFTAANSVLNGINKSPNQTTMGEGPVTGAEVRFSVSFSTPFILPEDNYFFVPQVQVTGGEFYWLSAPRPIVPPGTPFPAGSTDLQSWIRNSALDPDWLRIGTDITNQGPFNASFSLIGVPEPSSLALLGLGAFALVASARRRAIRR